MKKKINKQLMFILFVAVITTLILITAVFYKIFQAQVWEDMKTYAGILAMPGALESILADRYTLDIDDLRVTVVDTQGGVRYDSDADIGVMDNHSGRPEIQEALEKGEGWSVRQSDTMNRSTYYYTLLLSDGSVLRVAREAHSFWSILYRSLPAIGVMLVALIAVCMVLSHYLIKSLISPIEKMAADMDHIDTVTIYEELAPFAETIKEQHDAILRNADMRQEFTANVSHELKTPLTAISGYSQLIENGMATGQDAVRFATGIRQSADRLLTLINDIIKLSELDVMEQEIPMEELNLYEIARDTVEMMQIRAEARNVTLSMKGTPCTIQGDKQLIEELIYNLCDNAISYNNAGGSVLVEVEKTDGFVSLQVKDTGIGIPRKDQERVFERFYRVDKGRSKSTGGTGLGLAIVKHIVSVHHASLQLASEVGKGTDIKVLFSC